MKGRWVAMRPFRNKRLFKAETRLDELEKALLIAVSELHQLGDTVTGLVSRVGELEMFADTVTGGPADMLNESIGEC